MVGNGGRLDGTVCAGVTAFLTTASNGDGSWQLMPTLIANTLQRILPAFCLPASANDDAGFRIGFDDRAYLLLAYKECVAVVTAFNGQYGLVREALIIGTPSAVFTKEARNVARVREEYHTRDTY